MPIKYHGTSKENAIAMAANPGTIDVITKGGGEFGRGFYTQDSLGNAFRRGYLLYGTNGAVLVLSIDDPTYHALSFMRLSLNRAQMLNARLRSRNATSTYTTRHDVIVGPLVNQSKIMQQKFQSLSAQTLINGPRTQRTVRL